MATDPENLKALTEAAISNDSNTVKALINRGLSPDCWIPEDHAAERYQELTPLMLACQKHSSSVVRILIKAKCDVNLQDKDGNTALHFACTQGSKKIVKKLIVAGCNINIPNKESQTVIHYICESENLDLIKMLVKKRTQLDVQEKSKGHTPLMIACTKNNLPIVKMLLRRKCKLNIYDFDNLTASHHLFLHNPEPNFHLVKLLVKSGADIHAGEQMEKQTPLCLACKSASPKIVSFLLKSGDDQPCDWCSEMSLRQALIFNNMGVMEAILKYGIRKNFPKTTGSSLIIQAIQLGRRDAVKLLLKHNWSINETNEDGSTAIHIACATNQPDMITFLLSQNCDLNKANCQENTPLHDVCETGNLEVAVLLVNHGCNVNNHNKSRESPLYLACKFGHINIIKILLKAGSFLNNYGATSSFKASLERQKSISKLRSSRPYTIDKDIPQLLLEADFDLSQDPTIQPVEEYIHTFDRAVIEDNEEFFELLVELSYRPLTLKQLSFNVIRKCIGEQLQKKVQHLNLSQHLKDRLAYEME